MPSKATAPRDAGATFSPDEDPFAEQIPGTVHDWTIAEYLAHPAPSRSTLWRIWSESPYDYQWGQDHGEDKETDAMLLGSAIHLAVLEPDLFLTHVDTWDARRIKVHAERLGIDAPKASTARKGKLWDAVKAEADASGVLMLTPAQYERAKLVRDWIIQRKGIRRIFATGQAEKSLLWTDPATGVELLARPDFITQSGLIVDIKTTNDLGPLRAEPWKLMRKAKEFGYFAQASMMLDGARACGIDASEVHLFWVRSTGAPWARLTKVPESAIEEGRAVYREAAATWKKCMETGEWPGPEFKPEELPWEERVA